MFERCIFATILFAGLLVNGHGFAPPISASGYLDTVLGTALQYESRSRSLDPTPAPDFQTEFEDHVAIIGKVKGNVKYTEGKLYGLSKATRYGECFGPMMIVDRVFINCTIALNDLSIEYRGKLKFGKLPTVSITAKGNMTSTQVYVDVESYRRSPIPLIRNFRFIKIGEVQAKFTGLGSTLNKHLKVLEDDFKQKTWKTFFNAIGQDFQYVLNQAFARVAFPW